ncbi:hypothetical protein FBY14_110170 [Azospirillum brasilense]|nr:hypothetical protein FBY14_110170 [Azospirillum brasilense]
MKSLFKEFYPLTDSEYKALWREGIIVLDTNVLLRLFRYKEQTANDLLATLEKLKDQLWIPNQVAWEFHRRRLTKIDEGRKAYKDVIETLKKSSETIKISLEAFKGLGLHPVVDLENPVSAMRDQLSTLISEVEGKYEANPPHAHYGRLLDKITEIYEGKVGEGFSEEDLEKIYIDGKIRYENEVPPGFKDAKEKKDKTSRELYGDLLIWKETLRYARQNGKGIILVTEDQKRDWWERTADGRTIGPLPALRKEFSTEVGQLFQLYRVDQFAEWAAKHLNAPIKPESTKEIREEAKSAQMDEQLTTTFGNLVTHQNDAIAYRKTAFDKAILRIGNKIYHPSTGLIREGNHAEILPNRNSNGRNKDINSLQRNMDELRYEIKTIDLAIEQIEGLKNTGDHNIEDCIVKLLSDLNDYREKIRVKMIDVFDEIEDIRAGIYD